MPSALCTPKRIAVSLISQRSSWLAIEAKAVFTDKAVACKTVRSSGSSASLPGAHVPRRDPQRELKSVAAFHSLMRPSTWSFSLKPLDSHSARVKILYVEPLWKPEEPP